MDDKIKIIKRDGRKQKFNDQKIRNAISNAFKSCEIDDEEFVDNITKNVCEKVKDGMSVEEIQDMVEFELMKSRYKQVAKSYILYRDARTKARENKSKLMKNVAEKLMAINIVNQNANVDEASFGGRKGEANNEVMKWFALNNCMCKKSRDNHQNNEIYIHDLSDYAVGTHNCLSIPFDDLLAKGFNTRQTDIRPASSIGTAFQLVAVIFQLQSLQQFGGVSATHLDWTMVPYVRRSFRKHFLDGLRFIDEYSEEKINEIAKSIDKDTPIDNIIYNKSKAYKYAFVQTEKELKQAVEGMYHNLNY